MSSESAQPSRASVPESVESVRQRIERWRMTRERRTRMPEGLWKAAATVAQEHGVWRVSRILRVNYESLKKRVRSPAEDGGSAAGFVEVRPDTLLSEVMPGTTVLELSSGDGARLMVRLQGHALDVPALAAAFWHRHR